MDVSLNGLEKWLLDLDGKFSPDLRLQGHLFDRSSNECLGLLGETSGFTVVMPSESLTIRNRESAFPSATQYAFRDVVRKGLERIDNEMVLLDIATLAPTMQYLIQGGDESVINSLAKAVKDVGNKKVVIRLLVGDDKLSPNKEDVTRGGFYQANIKTASKSATKKSFGVQSQRTNPLCRQLTHQYSTAMILHWSPMLRSMSVIIARLPAKVRLFQPS